MNIDGKKIAKDGMAGVCYGIGCATTLAKWGLNASEVVFNGASNLVNSFVKAPDLGIGKSLFGTLQKQTANVAQYFFKKAKEFRR